MGHRIFVGRRCGQFSRYGGGEVLKKRTESHLQKNIVEWFRGQYPGVLLNIIPNTLQFLKGVSKLQRIKITRELKAMGFTYGFMDLSFYKMKVLDGRVVGGLFVEVKMPDGEASDDQKEWAKRLNEEGYLALISPIFDTEQQQFDWAIDQIKNYMDLPDYRAGVIDGAH